MRRYGLVDIPDVASDVGAIPVSSDSIISGGIVTWSGTGLVFNVSACNYYIDSVNYNSPTTTLTLSASDPTYDRIDVFAVDSNGDAIVITGIPSANPQEPQTDPATQLKLTTVIVQALATTPSGVTNNLIYDENVESWSKSNSSLTVDYVNTTTPYVGTYCILATTTSASTFKALSFYKTSTYSNKADYDIISFAIKLTQSLLSTESIKIIFSNTSLFPNTKVAEYSITSNNSIGLSFSNTSGYQLIGIPMSNITFTNNSFNYVQIQFVTSRTSISFRLDRILMQYGVTQPSSPTTSNSFGFVVSDSGTASATMATDTLSILGTGLASTSVSGKVLTIAVPSPISGTTNYISKFTPSGSLLGNSLVYDNGTSVAIGTTSPSSDNKFQVEGRIASNVSISSPSTSAYAIIGSTSLSYASGANISGIVTNAVQGGTTYSFGGSATIANSTITSSLVATSAIGFTSTGTVTQTQATGVRSMANIFSLWQRSSDVSGTVTHMSNLRLAALYSPYSSSTLTATNYYSILIEDAGQFSGVSLTNRWAIYQEGTSDNSYFAGKISIGSTTIGTEALKVVGSAIISSTVTLSNLAGSGSRMVVADASGVLSTQAIPSGGSGTVTSVAALTLGTTGTDLSSTVANSTTTPVITLNVPTASATNRGALSSSDWSTFNGKFTLPSLTNGSVLFSNGTTISQDNTNFFWDNTNKRLGIGITTPSWAIEVKKTSTDSWITTSRGANTVHAGILFNPNGAWSASNLLWNFALYRNSNNLQYWGYDGTTDKIMMTIFGGTSNVLIAGGVASVTDGGYRFDVSGTGRFQDNLLISKNQNAATIFTTSNTTSATGSYATLKATSDSGSGSLELGKYSTLSTTYKFIVGKDAYIYNGTIGGDISILNDFATGKIKFGSGGSSTAQMTLTSAGRLLIGTTTEDTSALVNVTSTTQGFLPPRMTTTQKNAISTPAAGLIVYDTTLNKLCVRTASAWETITSL